MNFYIGPGSHEFLHETDALFSIEKIMLVAVHGDDDEDAFKYRTRPLYHIEVPIGWRIERPGENSLDHAGTINRSPRGVKACNDVWTMARLACTVYHNDP
jgi:hypothetical protein